MNPAIVYVVGYLITFGIALRLALAADRPWSVRHHIGWAVGLAIIVGIIWPISFPLMFFMTGFFEGIKTSPWIGPLFPAERE